MNCVVAHEVDSCSLGVSKVSYIVDMPYVIPISPRMNNRYGLHMAYSIFIKVQHIES